MKKWIITKMVKIVLPYIQSFKIESKECELYGGVITARSVILFEKDQVFVTHSNVSYVTLEMSKPNLWGSHQTIIQECDCNQKDI